MAQARFHGSLGEIDATCWDRLRGDNNPFLSHAFLHGLEQHGCLQPRYGWRAHHLSLGADDDPRGAAPVYLKGNSHGEFVFDHRWADAYQRHGLPYYPKLLCAVPYSPVTGARLLRGQPDAAATDAELLQALQDETDRLGLSSAHVNFPRLPLAHPHWLPRRDWQFHWQRRDWQGFEDYLAALTSKKRKNIQQERAQVRRAGVQLTRHVDRTLSAEHMDAMYGFYLDTFDRKGNLPVLTPAFFQHLRLQLGDQLMLALAWRDEQPIAGALFLFDAQRLYGRYWGAAHDLPGLHFELCYYQGIEFCFERGIDVFEPGAQGEHKIARGFLPCATHSLHYIRDPRFRAAIAESLLDEARWSDSYGRELMQHAPYREPAPG